MAPPTRRDWDDAYDVVAVGSGAAGLTTAIVAAQHGARALVVEKDERLGGVTALSGGQIWIAPNSLAAARGIVDTTADAEAYMAFLASGLGSAPHRQAFVANAGSVVDALGTSGLELAEIVGMPDYYFPTAPGSKGDGRYLEVWPFRRERLGQWASRVVEGHGGMTTPHGGNSLTNADLIETGGSSEQLAQRASQRRAAEEWCMGAGLAANLTALALGAGVELWTGAAASALIGDEGVEGVVVHRNGESRRVRAGRGVALATGAYEWNPELVKTFEFVENMSTLVPPTVTGDHFSLAAPFGAAIATTLPQGASRHVGLNVPGEVWGGKPLIRMIIPGLPHGLMVNRAGRRFGDESFAHSYIAALYQFDGLRQCFPNWPAWFVFDQNYRDKYAIGPLAPGTPLPEGMAHEADSPAELAELAGIDPHGLEETIASFNRYAADGTDELFGRGSIPWSVVSWGDPTMKPNPNLGPLEKAPFYAIELQRVGTGICSAGLRTSTTGQVLTFRGDAVPGLYALGNAAARVEMGAGYNSGMAIGRSLTFGFLCAMAMCSAAAASG
jgi:3-oxosteroid 1-dehydrogenase